MANESGTGRSRQDYDEGDIVSHTFVESVCLRPCYYTVNGTLEEVYSFLRGYVMATNPDFIIPEKPAKAEPTPLDAIRWFYDQFSGLGFKSFEALRAKFGGNEEVLAALLQHLSGLKL